MATEHFRRGRYCTSIVAAFVQHCRRSFAKRIRRRDAIGRTPYAPPLAEGILWPIARVAVYCRPPAPARIDFSSLSVRAEYNDNNNNNDNNNIRFPVARMRRGQLRAPPSSIWVKNPHRDGCPRLSYSFRDPRETSHCSYVIW